MLGEGPIKGTVAIHAMHFDVIASAVVVVGTFQDGSFAVGGGFNLTSSEPGRRRYPFRNIVNFAVSPVLCGYYFKDGSIHGGSQDRACACGSGRVAERARLSKDADVAERASSDETAGVRTRLDQGTRPRGKVKRSSTLTQ